MSIEKVNEVSFFCRKRQRGKLAQYWSMMGFIFQIVRDIDPKLKYAIDTFTLLGLIWSTKIFFGLSITFIKGFYTHCWSRLWTLNLRKKYGEWVVITGATDGLGLEYARQFADRGHSLILVGRNASKLQKVKEELSMKMLPNQLVTILADFNDASSSLYDEIARQIEPYEGDIGILINNAGVMLESPNRFLDQNEESLWQHIRVNIAGVMMMTRVVLPAMVARKKGLIINVSSIAAYKPLALMGVYSASKKFVEYFSESLKAEYGKSHNIDVQTLVPFYISTKMVNWSNFLKKGNIFIPDAKSFVNSAIATIGRADYTTGYWSHELQYFTYEFLTPSWLYSCFSRLFIKTIDSSGMRAKDL